MGAVGGVHGITQCLSSFITAWAISCRQVIDISAHGVWSSAASVPLVNTEDQALMEAEGPSCNDCREDALRV